MTFDKTTESLSDKAGELISHYEENIKILNENIKDLKKINELEKEIATTKIDALTEQRDDILHMFEAVLVDIKKHTGYIPYDVNMKKDIIEHVRNILYGCY